MDPDDPARKYLPKPKAEKPPKSARSRRSVGVLDDGDWVLIGVYLAIGIGGMAITENFGNPWAWIGAIGGIGGCLVVTFVIRLPEQHRQPLFGIGIGLLLAGLLVPPLLTGF